MKSTVAKLHRIALAATLMLIAACATPPGHEAEQALRAGDYDRAIALYREASLRNPGDAELRARLREVEASGAEELAGSAQQALAEGHYERALELGHKALGYDPGNTRAEGVLRQARPAVDQGRRVIREALTLAETGGQAVDALAMLEESGEARGMTAWPDAVARVRRAAAAELRERAQALLRAGDVAQANADLERARALEAAAGQVAGSPGGAASEQGGAGATPDSAAGQPGPRDLDAYADAAHTIQGLVEGLPRRPTGGGLARPEDYAVSEEDLPRLRSAIQQALRLKPAEEASPRWLTRGRLVLRMSNEVWAKRRLGEALRLVGEGKPGEGLALAASVRELDRDIANDPEIGSRMSAVYRATAEALLSAAERAERSGLHNLAALRAKQAIEADPSFEARATAIVRRATAGSARPAVVLYPLQDFTERGGVGQRLADAVRAGLERGGAGPLLSFEDYTRDKRAGSLPRLAGLLRGDVVKLEVRQARSPAEAAEEQIDVLEDRVRDARRRMAEAPDRAARLRALEEVDALEREMARARRRQGASVLTGGGGAAEGAPQVVVTLELRFGLYAAEGGARIVEETFARTRTGPASAAAEHEQALLDEAAARIAAVVSTRLREVESGTDPAALSDPHARLDAQIALLSRSASPSASDSTVREVLDATGYSFAERKTLPERLRLTGP